MLGFIAEILSRHIFSIARH